MATKKGSTGATVGMSLGVAAAAATAAAGAYWLYGTKDAARNRKQVQSWMLKARADVLDGIEKLSEVDKQSYLALVDEVLKRYNGATGATGAEMARIGRELKDAWKMIQSTQKKPAKKGAKSVAAKKAPAKKAPAKKKGK